MDRRNRQEHCLSFSILWTFFRLLKLIFNRKMGETANSVSFDARDLKIMLHILNIVVILNWQKLCAPRQFSPLSCRFSQNRKFAPLTLECDHSGFLIERNMNMAMKSSPDVRRSVFRSIYPWKSILLPSFCKLIFRNFQFDSVSFNTNQWTRNRYKCLLGSQLNNRP